MKKLLTILLSGSIGAVFAMTSTNLDTTSYYCNNVKLTSHTTIDAINMNCKNTKVVLHQEPSGGMYANREPGGGADMTMSASNPNDDMLLDKVEFYTDSGSYLKCYYKNNKYVKCKVKAPKTLKASGKISSSNTVSKN